MKILGIETSCDETAAAVVDDGPRLLRNVIHTQTATHAPFGGVVPELASREHVDRIATVVARATFANDANDSDEYDEHSPCDRLKMFRAGLKSVDAIAVTTGPGLVGALLVGSQFARGLSLATGIPWIGINHLEGHLSAALLDEQPPTYPHVALVVSGGHTQLYQVRQFGDYRKLGGTRDDAAGEAFDKVAKMLGLGYPGGVAVERCSRGGDSSAHALPRAMNQRGNLDFSFSGLKTACRQLLIDTPASENQKADLKTPSQSERSDFCASLQEAIGDILSKKAVAAAKSVAATGIVLAGGVAANTRLRQLIGERCAAAGLWAYLPPPALCTDNAAMIAAAGWRRLRDTNLGDYTPIDSVVRSRWSLGELTPP